MFNERMFSPKDQFQEKLDEMTEELIKEIQSITGDFNWLSVYNPKDNWIYEKIIDIFLWDMAGVSVYYENYKDIHPKLDGFSLEKAVEKVLEKIGGNNYELNC